MALCLCPSEHTPAQGTGVWGPQGGLSVPRVGSVSPGRPTVFAPSCKAESRRVSPQGPRLPSRLWVPGARSPPKKGAVTERPIEPGPGDAVESLHLSVLPHSGGAEQPSSARRGAPRLGGAAAGGGGAAASLNLP